MNMDQKIKLSFTNVQYTANEEEQYVECRMDVGLKAGFNTSNVIKCLRDDHFDTVVYRARPKSGDTFDAEIGKSVARATAEKMAYERTNRMLRRVALKIFNTIADFADFDQKVENVVEHSDKYLAKF